MIVHKPFAVELCKLVNLCNSIDCNAKKVYNRPKCITL